MSIPPPPLSFVRFALFLQPDLLVQVIPARDQSVLVIFPYLADSRSEN